MKKILSLVLVIAAMFITIGCQNNQESQEHVDVKIAAPVGPPALSVMNMIKEEPTFDNANVEIELMSSPETLAPAVMSKEADIALVPTNLAATLYNNEANVQIAGSVNWGVLYLVSTDDSIKSWSDLKGKKITGFGRGLTPDVTFRYLLNENGLNPDKDVTFNYLSAGPEVAQTLIAGKNTVGIVAEPMVSQILSKNKNAKIVLDIQEEWQKATDSDIKGFPQVSIVVNKDLIEKRPQLVESILEAIKSSSDWANENPSELGKFAESVDKTFNAAIIAKNVERFNINYVPASEAKDDILTYLKALHGYSPDFVGGSVPDDNLFLK